MKNYDIAVPQIYDDKLDRLQFAKRFADAIDQMDIREEGFVAALTGPWGSGKSTLINFIVHFIRQKRIAYFYQKNTEKSFSDISDLPATEKTFFKIKKTIDHYSFLNKNFYLSRGEFRDRVITDHIESGADIDDVYNYMIAEKQANDQPTHAIIRFSPWALGKSVNITQSIISEISIAISDNFEEEVKENIKNYLKYISLFTTTTTARSLGIQSDFNNAIDRIFEKKQKSINEIKHEISNQLLNSKSNIKNIIIIIDDLDRINKEECHELISAIKGIANMPRVFYLLSYDQNAFSSIVAKSIHEQDNPEKGHEFLNKIVQYSREIPLPQRSKMAQIFQEHLLELLEAHNQTQNTTKERISYVWENIISKYAKTPRDLKRLFNSYAMSISAVGEITEPSDLLTLTAIEVFDYDSYKLLRDVI
ncbi:MAG: hypothetical protein GYB19_07355 [Rhodospirillales bacterium]|nr:hypothetical protein [Rhodospirillales bacterium]